MKHIGKLIGLRLDQVGMSKAEFARRIHRSPQNVHDILSRSSIDTSLLLLINKALDYNFFKAFLETNQVHEELKGEKLGLEIEITNVQNAIKQLRKEYDSLKCEILELQRRSNGKSSKNVTSASEQKSEVK